MRRLILSRKGFDSSAGAGASSPHLPDDRLVSLPIPESTRIRPDARTRYADLKIDGLDYARLVRSLYPRSFDEDAIAHLDPDLAAGTRDGRDRRIFRGLFGQAGTAAKHLSNQGVGEGDLFLFFGRFRATEPTSNGSFRFVPGSEPFHAIFGYLEVGERIDVPLDELEEDRRPKARAWAPDFPHFLPTFRKRPAPETVYVATKELSFSTPRPGFGLFRLNEGLRLTRPESSRLSGWRLPAAFDEVNLTYNPRTIKRDWCVCGAHVEFFAAAREQEFVCEPTPTVESWATRLVVDSDLWEP